MTRETKDVATEYPEVVQELEAEIDAFQKDLDKHSLEAPFDAGQAAYLKTKEKNLPRRNVKRIRRKDER